MGRWGRRRRRDGKIGRIPPRDIRKLLDEYKLTRTHFTVISGHGCIHMRVSFDLESVKWNSQNMGRVRRNARRFSERKLRRSLYGEHGDGQARGALLPKMCGARPNQGLVEFKSIWDQDNKMNPGTRWSTFLLPTEKLRLGATINRSTPKTYFSFRTTAVLRKGGVFEDLAGRNAKHDSGRCVPATC